MLSPTTMDDRFEDYPQCNIIFLNDNSLLAIKLNTFGHSEISSKVSIIEYISLLTHVSRMYCIPRSCSLIFHFRSAHSEARYVVYGLSFSMMVWEVCVFVHVRSGS